MLINKKLLDKLTIQAKASPRLRMNYDLRDSKEDESQRMLNAIEPGTVIPIHRHTMTSEDVVILRGRAEEVLFDDHGNETGRWLLTPRGEGGQGTGTEVNPNCWTVKQSLRIRELACTGQVTYH